MSQNQKNKLQPSQRGQLAQKVIAFGTIGALLLAGIFMVQTSSVTEISGVINDYTKVTTISNDSITVNDASSFSVNDRVLLIQMKGAIISETDDSSYGDVVSWESAGVYEFNFIKSISGNTVVLNFEPCKSYNPNYSVQMIRVPEYDSVKVTSTLRPEAWDGEKGGVLVLFANDRVRLDADIDVSEKGFTGGAFNGSARGRSLTYVCDVNSGQGGRKGEGITEVTVNGCRGKLANGGGGGNDHNGGGGGGGNYGSGGVGGHGWKSNSAGNLSDLDKGGLGGLSLENLYMDGVPRLFMGGGGGGGHQNNGASFPGGDGGGIVIIITPELLMEKRVNIKANGEDAQDITINDGSSGGGAGGSILLDVQTYINDSDLNLYVKGGDGADITTADQHGPGGGGGGGLINTTSSLPAGVTTYVSGGTAGIFHSTKSSHTYDETSHGAGSGDDGAILSNLVIQKCSKAPTIDLNGSESGTDYTNTFYPNGPAQRLLGEATDIDDEDDTEMSSGYLELDNPVDGSNEYLAMDPAYDSTATGVKAVVSVDGHRIDFSGQASIATYQSVIEQVVYNDTAQSMDQQDRYFSVQVDDGGRSSNTATITLSMSDVNFPVEWLFFQVSPQNEAAKLEWATATEMNSHYFEVQRSWDGSDFDPIGQVEAAGNSQTAKNYDFLDRNVMQAPKNEVLYRLKQVDIDGKFEYSNLISLNIGEMQSNVPKLTFPNPASGVVPIGISTSGEFRGKLSLLSLNGQVIRSESLSGNGFQQVSWDVGSLTPGVYLLSFQSGTKTLSKKMVVQR